MPGVQKFQDVAELIYEAPRLCLASFQKRGALHRTWMHGMVWEATFMHCAAVEICLLLFTSNTEM